MIMKRKLCCMFVLFVNSKLFIIEHPTQQRLPPMKLAGVAVMAAIASSSSDAFNLLLSTHHHRSPLSSSIFFRSVDVNARNHPRSRVASILSASAISADYAGSNDNNDDNNNASMSSSSSHAATDGITMTKQQQKRIAQIRNEGGIFAFNTKFGALNPFAIYYGITSILLGFVWVTAITACDVLYKLTGNKIDVRRRVPVFLSHIWGRLLMLFTGCTPTIVNGNIVKDFHKR
jgi:hypothetical protein